MNALAKLPDALADFINQDSAFFDDLPDDAPLDMPAQSLRRRGHARPLKSVAAVRLGGLVLATLALTALALLPIGALLGADSFSALDVVILALVGLLFAWGAFSFLSAVAGFLAMGGRAPCPLGLDENAPLPQLKRRTAVLMPIYNEAPEPVFSRLRAICESIDAAGEAGSFDAFVLSDSTDAAVQASEYRHYRRLRLRLRGAVRVFYRHRRENVARKAGNIADWVRRFGGAYDHMVVLDADSLMEGATLVRLAGAMERAPDVGLIQTAPAIINRQTLFARAEQFASRLYGPMLAHGVAWWSGSEGNYWGHNAIIRVAAFARHAGLPQLAGPKPFGGHVLSHDFVEAALLRRAGWRVLLAPRLRGSYEESPPTLAGLLARDRRWSQGNLQHTQIVWARGLHWISRFHLVRGISAYLVAPIWLMLLACATLLALFPQWGESVGVRVYVGDRSFDLQAAAATFAVALGFLVVPKALAYVRMLGEPAERARFGGPALAAVNIVAETLLSTLVAPLIMISHTRSIAAALSGRDSGWTAQAREATRPDLVQSLRLHAMDTLFGCGLLAVALATCRPVFAWMSPVIVSLTLAVPAAMALASNRLGGAARRAGLLLTPEERQPPQILVRANAHRAHWPKP
ncbi:MAG: glucans biosynthesis glucosyltransferase MdoH [Caulobacteraceae bacterium]|nr:glucans biosynthesis glucosyltransferase MdoH [Caulobacteraceae bacterium]